MFQLQTNICTKLIWGPSQYKDVVFPGMEIPMLKIRRSRDSLLFNMGISYLEKWSLYWDGPWIRSCCNIGYSSLTYLRLKSPGSSVFLNICFGCLVALKFCMEHDNISVGHCAKFQNDWANEKYANNIWFEDQFQRSFCIDLSHKYHNAPVPYPIMHHFVTEMWAYLHISYTNECIVRYLHCGICELGLSECSPRGASWTSHGLWSRVLLLHNIM